MRGLLPKKARHPQLARPERREAQVTIAVVVLDYLHNISPITLPRFDCCALRQVSVVVPLILNEFDAASVSAGMAPVSARQFLKMRLRLLNLHPDFEQR